jgi:predicted anti-sigma-YlaC factor YlaD
MKNNCDFTDKVWDALMQGSIENNTTIKTHIENCSECAQLSHQMNAWKADQVEDNPYLTQKVMDKITATDINYNKNGRFVTRLAFSTAIFIGVIIGFAFTFATPTQQTIEKTYQEKINTFSNETYYNEIKTDETQVLLTDLN